MKIAYMPFTYLPASTAHVLATLVGPVTVYQPLETRVLEHLADLAAQGIIEIRTPVTGDDRRLTAALAEFTQWAAQNPGRSTPGTGFVGSRQGKVPFYDESAVSRLRSDIKQYGTPPKDSDAEETGFSARLFLAVAEENDRTTANLDQDLQQFKALEKGLLQSLSDGDQADFSRHALGSAIWQEDPGAKHTDRRFRAWATLAVADREWPDLLITTSPAVMDTLMDSQAEAIRLQRLQSIRLPVPFADQPPVLNPVLADLMRRQSLTEADCEGFAALGDNDPEAPAVVVTLYAAIDCRPSSVIRQMAPAAVMVPEANTSQKEPRHTLIVLIEMDAKSE